jgi:hypothetical protein
MRLQSPEHVADGDLYERMVIDDEGSHAKTSGRRMGSTMNNVIADVTMTLLVRA